jgi:hypothetical protein
VQIDPFPWFFFDMFSLIFLIFPIIFCIAVILGFRNMRRFSSPKAFLEGFAVQPPSHVYPEDSRSDGSDIRTVHLPNYCPKCGAALSQEEIDWTGPLEAKCNYCGGSVKATLEKL